MQMHFGFRREEFAIVDLIVAQIVPILPVAAVVAVGQRVAVAVVADQKEVAVVTVAVGQIVAVVAAVAVGQRLVVVVHHLAVQTTQFVPVQEWSAMLQKVALVLLSVLEAWVHQTSSVQHSVVQVQVKKPVLQIDLFLQCLSQDLVEFRTTVFVLALQKSNLAPAVGTAVDRLSYLAIVTS